MAVGDVKIVLMEPAGARNVGSIARVMKNFGLSNLVLVNPQCDYLEEEALKMAVHADDVLKSARIVDTLPQALQGCKRAIATTARTRDWNIPLETPRMALPWLLELANEPTALIFGREDRGLSNEELNYAQRFIKIPTNEEYASLNLAAAVSICCYELRECNNLQSHEYSIYSDQGTSVTENSVVTEQSNYDQNKKLFADISEIKYDIAPLDVVEAYYQQLESLLLKIGYLHPHTATSRMGKFRQLYNRSQLQNKEVAMLRGILRQVDWALSQKSTKDSSKLNSKLQKDSDIL
ncbi:MAG: RNA methyltransferase [Mastigocoleus sp.]